MPKVVIDKELIHKELGTPLEVLELLSEKELKTQTSLAKRVQKKREGTYKEYKQTGSRTSKPIKKDMWIQRIYDSLETPRDKILFLAGIFLGLRVSDIVQLKYGQLKTKTENSTSLIETKTKKVHTLYVNKLLRDAVDELGKEKGLKDDDYLFLSRNWKKQLAEGKPPHISTVQAYRILQAAAKKCRYPGQLSCHSLRKTFGYFQFKAGVPLAVLMDMFNHSSEQITLRYIGITQEEKNKHYQKLDKLYGFRG